MLTAPAVSRALFDVAAVSASITAATTAARSRDQLRPDRIRQRRRLRGAGDLRRARVPEPICCPRAARDHRASFVRWCRCSRASADAPYPFDPPPEPPHVVAGSSRARKRAPRRTERLLERTRRRECREEPNNCCARYSTSSRWPGRCALLSACRAVLSACRPSTLRARRAGALETADRRLSLRFLVFHSIIDHWRSASCSVMPLHRLEDQRSSARSRRSHLRLRRKVAN